MSYKPILFSTEMVRAILYGRKTQTRRVIAGTPDNTYRMDTDDGKEWFAYYGVGGEGWLADLSIPVKPRYQTGDVLWVRETWQVWKNTIGFPVDGFYFINGKDYAYKADDYSENSDNHWRPSIFMPKESCRLFLRVTGVRAEKVQDITEEDAIAEGVRVGIGGMPYFSCVDAFQGLWNSINAKRGYGWDINPWVWVYAFERIDMPKGWPNV